MCKAFTNEDFNAAAERGEIVQYGYYHRYWLPDGTRNPDAVNDIMSKRILDVKDKRERGLNFFYGELDELFAKDITICVVPSHSASQVNDSGIAILAKRLASNGRIDKVDFLLRTQTINKLSHGGQRDVEVHKTSIATNPHLSISGDVVLIVDDVTTSGASLRACKEILEEAGAAHVAMFALGRTV